MRNKRFVLVFRMSALSVCLALGGLVSGGCATVVKGTSQTAKFESDPAGATVRMGGQVLGTTPCNATFKKKDIGVVEFALDGYQTRFVNPNLEGKLNVEPWFWGNLGWLLTGPGALIGCPVGSLVDVHTGAMYNLTTPFCVSLYVVGSQTQPSPSPFEPPPPTSGRSTEIPAAKISNEERLDDLKALRDKGTITQEEYDQKRQKILDAL